TLKSNGRTFGATSLAETCQELETAAGAGALEGAARLVGRGGARFENARAGGRRGGGGGGGAGRGGGGGGGRASRRPGRRSRRCCRGWGDGVPGVCTRGRRRSDQPDAALQEPRAARPSGDDGGERPRGLGSAPGAAVRRGPPGCAHAWTGRL